MSKRGGNRPGAGRKKLPTGEKKVQIEIGIEQDFIDEWGGLKTLQKDIRAFVYGKLGKPE